MSRRSLLLAALLGLAAGTLEVGLRAAPRLGLSTGQVLAWLGVSAALSALYTLLAALGVLLLGALLRRWRPGLRLPADGLVLAALLLLHAALWYRFERVLNLFLYDPRVWGVELLILAVSLALSPLLQRLLDALRGNALPLAGALALLGAGLALGRSLPRWPEAPAPRDAPNLLLVTLDTTRRDALSPYAPERETPAAARLAREGVTFELAVAPAPLTEPSHLAMLTGLYPYHTGVLSNGTELGEQPALLGHALRRAGYATAAFVSGFPLHGKYGWTQAFDVYDDDFGRMPGLHRLSLVKAWDQVSLPAHALRERTGDLALARALAWLDRAEASGRPWFLWLHLFDPHAPYVPPPPYAPTREPRRLSGPALDLPSTFPPEQRSITDPDWFVEAYHGEVRYADHLLGVLLDRLDRDGLQQRTAVLLVADHGESLTEHDYYFDHGDHLYDPSLLVPLLVRYPPLARAGLRQRCQVSTVDVAPTLLALAGLDDGLPRDGRSLLPYLRREDCPDQEAVSSTVAGRFVEQPPVDYSLRVPSRKYIRHGQGGSELYDLEADPGETRDLSAERPEELDRFSRALDAKLSSRVEARGPSQDADTIEALRALGYLE